MKIFKTVVLAVVYLTIAGFIAVKTAGYVFYNKTLAEIAVMKNTAMKAPDVTISEKDLAGIPKQMADYLRASGVIGKKKIKYAVLKETGAIKSDPKAKWMPFIAEQVFSGEEPGFIWFATCSMGGMPVTVRDIYYKGYGNMLVKPFSMFSIIDGKGPEIDQSAFGRCFGELTLLPTAFLNKGIKWEQAGKNTVKAVMTDCGVNVSAFFKFNEKKECEEFIADRFTYENGKYTARKFIGRSSDYKVVDGFRIPFKLSGSWVLESGEFEYVRLKIEEIRYY